MRIFVGLDLPEAVITSLNCSVAALRPTAPSIGWVPAGNLHITTKFVGQWEVARLEELKSALSAIPKPGPIPIRIEGLGWFPNPQSPRVFWVGVSGTEALRTLAGDTGLAVAKLGVEAEKREFHPHLTLARITRQASSNLSALGNAVDGLGSRHAYGSFVAQSFFLYLSEPLTKAKGSKYTKLAEFPLTP